MPPKSLWEFMDEMRAAIAHGRRPDRIRNTRWPEQDFLTLQAGYPEGIAINQNTADATGLSLGERVIYPSYFQKYIWDRDRAVYVGLMWEPTMADTAFGTWELHSRPIDPPTEVPKETI